MFKHIPAVDESVSMEKMQYMLFYRNYTAYRTSFIPSRIVDMSTIQLPNGSTLHTVNHFLDTLAPKHLDPDITNPLITNEAWMIYLLNVLTVPGADATPFGVDENYVFSSGRFASQITSFYNTHHHLKRPMSPHAVENRQNALLVFDYTSLLAMRVQGRLAQYRKFLILFKTILNNVVNSPDTRHQFIHLPMSDFIYTRSQVMRCFHEISPSTLRVHDDMSFFFLIHLLGLVWSQTNDAHPMISDDFVHPPSSTADSNPKGYHTTSLFEEMSDEVLDRTNVVLTRGNKGIIYNLGDLKKMSDNSSMFLRVIRHVNLLKMVHPHDPLPAVPFTDNEIDAHTDQSARTDENDDRAVHKEYEKDTPEQTAEPIVAPMITSAPTDTAIKEKAQAIGATLADGHPLPEPVEPPAKAPAPVNHTYVKHVDNTIATKVETKHESLAQVHEQRIADLTKRHMAVTFAGKTIAEHLANTTNPNINDAALDFLKDDITDPSMLTSSIADLNKLYMKHLYARDIVQVLHTLTTQGKYVTGIVETPIVTQLDRMTNYKVSIVDVAGKSHQLVFDIPHVDDNGEMLMSGVKYRMVSQETNLPICKVSPTRVNLSSDYNKSLVERTQTKAHTFETFIVSYLSELQRADAVSLEYGAVQLDRDLPYEYAVVGRRFSKIHLPSGTLFLDYPHRFAASELSADNEEQVTKLESLFGVFFGIVDGNLLFIDGNNQVHVVTTAGVQTSVTTLPRLLNDTAGEAAGIAIDRISSEWTELKYLDENFPVVFVLGYQYGLSAVLKLINAKYTFIPAGKRVSPDIDDVVIPFNDGNLVFSRYPLQKSLILSGLLKYRTKNYDLAEFDTPDVYFRVLADHNIATNYLKGITALFDFFIDPITFDVLKYMHEPTTFRDLLVRATQMLSTDYAKPSSSGSNHRLRGYERIASTLYNVMARQLAAYNAKKSHKKAFSINPKDVFLRIRQDSTVQTVDEINPVHDIKGKSTVTFSGSGGRTAQSFVTNDRRYPDDAVGIISEATPDSGKVAINAYTTADPRISNIRGMFKPPAEDLAPAQVLSATSMLIPGATQDDGKRANFISIQLSHHVGCDESEVSLVRTGFENVIAHRTSETFACPAKEDGVVIGIDNKTNTVKVQYADKPITPIGTRRLPYTDSQLEEFLRHGEIFGAIVQASEVHNYTIDAFYSVSQHVDIRVMEILPFSRLDAVPDKNAVKAYQDTHRNGTVGPVAYLRLQPMSKTIPGDIDLFMFGDKYTSVSGSNLRQDIVLNVELGEHFKRGDILAYNRGFFEPDPDSSSKQVSWKHGVMANIALIETSATLEDACMITAEFGEKIKMSPAHVRDIRITNKTVLHSIVDIGDHVETTDLLCTIEEGDLDALSISSDPETTKFYAELNKKSPMAKYHGAIAKIEVYYSCDPATLHPSIAKLVRQCARKQHALALAAKGTLKESAIPDVGRIDVGTKFAGTLFEEDTVLILITITEDIACGRGDKFCIMSANKTIVSEVMRVPPKTASGKIIDIIFSATSVMNRIIQTPFLSGTAIPVMEAVNDDAVRFYFS